MSPTHIVFFFRALYSCKEMAYTDKSFPSGLNLISKSRFLWHLYPGLYLVTSGWPWITNCAPTLMAFCFFIYGTIIFWTIWPGCDFLQELKGGWESESILFPNNVVGQVKKNKNKKNAWKPFQVQISLSHSFTVKGLSSLLLGANRKTIREMYIK